MKSLIVIAMLLVLLLGLSEMSRCSTNSKKSDTTCWLPEGCVTQYQDNPYTYKAGSVSAVSEVDDAIVIRIQPLATYSIFTEDILFCDAKKVELLGTGKHNPVLLTYKTKASHLVQGIGCHDLVRVDEFKEGKA
jgi:hypothetical protein